jgi:lipid-A-disaccharide synthase
MSEALKVPDLPKSLAGKVDVLVIAGEHSGDEQASRMVKRVLREKPDLKVAALGGKHLEEAGAQLLYDMTISSVVGFVEVLKSYSFFKELFGRIIQWIETYQPSIVCLVDYPGLNLRIAKELFNRGISQKAGGPLKVVYYIAPQVWAWKEHRRFQMARWLDSLGVIFPFEIEVFADTHLPVEFLGHPFMEEEFENKLSFDPNGAILLLPGSRSGAVRRIFPALVDGFAKYLEHSPDARAVTLYPSDKIRDLLEELLPEGLPVDLRPSSEGCAARAVLTSSGTMSLTCALAGIPGAIAYRANTGTYWLAKSLVNVPFLGIANLLLRNPMYPEYIQQDSSAEALAEELETCQSDRRIERAHKDSMKLKELLKSSQSTSPETWLLQFLKPDFHAIANHAQLAQE